MPKTASLRPVIANICRRVFGWASLSLVRSLILTPVFLYTRARKRVPARVAILFILGIGLGLGLTTNLFKPAQTAAATNNVINFQSRLETNTGAVAVDGVYNVEFKLYSASSGGSPEWTEDHLINASNGITVVNGYLTANLGSITAFSGINWDQQQWLTMNIGQTPGTSCTPFSSCSPDGEMSPRLQLTAVPYAFRAGQLADPANSGATLTWVAQSAANAIQLPNEGGTLCIQSSANCGFAAGTSASYIQNQSASPQSSANFNIDGSGKAGTSFIAPSYTSTGALSVTSASGSNLTLSAAGTATASLDGTTLNLGNSAATSISIGNNAASHTISIGAGGSGANVETINIGSTSSTSPTAIKAGTSGVTFTPAGGSTNNGVLIKPSSDTSALFQIQNAATAVDLFNVDSTNSGAISLLTNNSGETETWQTNANNLTAALRKHGTVILNGYIYAIGGVNSGGTDQSTVMYAKLNANGSTGTWANASNSLPASRSVGAVTAANGYLYYLGGSSGGTGVDTVYFAKQNADGTPGTWQCQGTTTPCGTTPVNSRSIDAGVAFKFGNAFTANGYIYAVGSDGAANTSSFFAKLNTDGTTGVWSSTNGLSTTVNLGGLAVANGYVYLAGGETSGGAGRTTTFYSKINTDGTLGTWKCDGTNSTDCGITPTAVLTFPSGAVADVTTVQADNGYLYVIGGLNSGSSATTSTFYTKLNADGSLVGYSTSANALPSTLFWSSSASSNGYIYTTGGSSGSLGSPTVLNKVYYVSLARISVAGSLDLVGTSGQDLSGSSNFNGQGGSLTAGNTLILGTLGVSSAASFLQGVTISGTLSVADNAALSGNTIQIGNTSSGSQVNVDCGAAAASCAFGTTANAHTTTIGSSSSTSTTTIQGGSGGTSIDSSGAVSVGATNATSVAVGNTANSTITENVKNSSSTAYVLQTASSVSLLTADTTNSKLIVGSATGSATPILLVLANKNTSGDPTETDGAMYYNSNTKNFRCGNSGTWQNCLGGLLNSTTAVSSTISNCGTGGTACASFSNGVVSIPANYCTPGRVIHIFASGWYSSTSGGPGLDFGVYMGTDPTVPTNDTLISRSNNLSTGASQTAAGWDIDYSINCYTSGTSGSVVGQGTANVTKAAGSGTTNTVVMTPTSLGGTSVINTTNALNVYLFPIWATPSVNNTIVCFLYNVYAT